MKISYQISPLTATALAEALGVSRQTINELLRERRSVSPIMALKLARLFGNSPEFWMKQVDPRKTSKLSSALCSA